MLLAALRYVSARRQSSAQRGWSQKGPPGCGTHDNASTGEESKATDEALTADYFPEYAREKFGDIYGVDP